VSDGNLIISGNVGIGTASPLTSFDIKPLANQHLLVFSNGVGNGIGMSAVVDANNADVPLAIDALSLILNPNSNGNVGIGTRSPAGILDVTSTTSAFLPPRMTTTQKNAISPVVDGMVVYDTTLHGLYVYSTGTSTWQTMGSQTALPYIKVSETETSGINGGNATTGNWTARVLNTKDSDTSSIASLCTSNGVPVATCTAANQVVLPAGTYLVKVTSPFCRTSLTQIRLYNVTGAASVLLGESTYGVAGYTCMSDSLRGVFTLSTPSALSVQYQVSGSTANNDLGQPDSFGTEVYTVVDFSKTG
jgi:hypothetical protein